MKYFFSSRSRAQAFALCLATLLGPGLAFSDPNHHAKDEQVTPQSGDNFAIRFLPSNKSVKAGNVNYKFTIVNPKNNVKLSPDDLAVEHERKLHMLVYDPSLNEFQHVHPTFKEKQWQVPLSFSVDGNYWVWLQGKTSEGTEFSLSQRLLVSHGKPAHSLSENLVENRKFSDGTIEVNLDQNEVKAGQEAMLTMTISRKDKVPLKLVPYLGAFAHVVATPSSGNMLIHVHPMNGKKSNEGMIHAKFPLPGSYKLWIQFQENGKVITAPVTIVVT